MAYKIELVIAKISLPVTKTQEAGASIQLVVMRTQLMVYILQDANRCCQDERCTLDTYNKSFVGLQRTNTLAQEITYFLHSTFCHINGNPRLLFQVYSLFTRSMFMVGGRLVSEGTPSQVLAHFKDVGYECPATSNPADFVIQILSAGSISDVRFVYIIRSTCIPPIHAVVIL